MGIKNNLVVVFDLDDTLYNEVDFLKSAYKEIARYLADRFTVLPEPIYAAMLSCYYSGLNVFEDVIETFHFQDVSINDLLEIYRNHLPDIQLSDTTQHVLTTIKKDVFKVGLITDGRRVQQRNKLKALGLSDYFDTVIISEEFGHEKPSVYNYKYFVNTYGGSSNYVYIGDNTRKDFISPNDLGWRTICILDNGKNIHKQSFDSTEALSKPDFVIKNMIEIEALINQIT